MQQRIAKALGEDVVNHTPNKYSLPHFAEFVKTERKFYMENSIEMVIDKVRGLIDLLFSVSTGIEYGLTPCEDSVALLAEIAQEIECDLKEVLQADDSDNRCTDTSLEKWCDELLAIFKRLDWFGRSEVLLYADKVEKKRLNEV